MFNKLRKNLFHKLVLALTLSLLTTQSHAIALDGFETGSHVDPYFNFKTCGSRLNSNANNLLIQTKSLRKLMSDSPEMYQKTVRLLAQSSQVSGLAQFSQILQIDDSNIHSILNKYGSCENAENGVVYMLSIINSIKFN
ncbi:MAG: hypothetical protein ACK4VO_02885 [Pseudobdellovibrio sp.]